MYLLLSTSHQIKSVKDLLLSLKPTGIDGFEGLLSKILQELTGVPFRLAQSGSQFGEDGYSTYLNAAISFEAKLYNSKLVKKDILSKMAELPSRKSDVEIWILGATVAASTQLIASIRALEHELGLSVIVLDWNENQLSPLLIAICHAKSSFIDFFKSNNTSKANLHSAEFSIDSLKASPEYFNHIGKLKESFNEASSCYLKAKELNMTWLKHSLSTPQISKVRFGQQLIPENENVKSFLPRQKLEEQIQQTLNEKHGFIVVMGDEGNGKSWAVTQACLHADNPPVILIIRSGEINSGQVISVETFIIDKIIEQTGDKITHLNKQRWQRRLKQWKQNKISVVVIIDGINENPSVNWASVIDQFVEELKTFSGKLLVTSRTFYFEHSVSFDLESTFTRIMIPEWSANERDELLTSFSLAPEDLHQHSAKALLNPRLLGIALQLYADGHLTSISEISITRLLFEHIRLGSRLNLRQESANEFTDKLKVHAKDMLRGLGNNEKIDVGVTKGNLAKVIDGRFFKVVDSDEGLYSIHEESLPLALGLAVVSVISRILRNGGNIDEELTKLIEPLLPLDQTCEIVLAALSVEVLKQNRTPVVCSLLKCFTNIQNKDNGRYSEFQKLTSLSPLATVMALRDVRLEISYRSSSQWLKYASLSICESFGENCDIEQEILSWLTFSNLDPKISAWIKTSQSDEKNQLELRKSESALEKKLSDLSIYEKSILGTLTKVKYPRYERLHSLAFELLAGKPLVNYCAHFIQASFSRILNSDNYSSATDDFINLIRFNRVDWQQTYKTFQRAIVLVLKDSSDTGKWLAATIYSATGEHSHGIKRQHLIKLLFSEKDMFVPCLLLEEYCASDPCDPMSQKPLNVEKTSEDYKKLDLSSVRQSLGPGGKTLHFEMARAGLARFVPEIVIDKHRELLQELLTRDGIALDAAILECERHSVLLTPSLAKQLVARWKYLENEELSDDRNWKIQRILIIALPHLAIKEQLEVLFSAKSKRNILLSLLDLIIEPLAYVLDDYLTENLKLKNTDGQFLALFIANYHGYKFQNDTLSVLKTTLYANDVGVKEQTLGAIHHSENYDLIKLVIDSGWDANNCGFGDRGVHYGSRILLQGMQLHLISYNEVLKRIKPSIFGIAITYQDASLKQEIIVAVENSIQTLSDHMEQEKFPTEYARDIIQSFKTYSFNAAFEYDATASIRWCKTLKSIHTSKLIWLKKFIIKLSEVIAKTNPKGANLLLEKVGKSDPYFNHAYQGTGLHIEAVADWRVCISKKLTRKQADSLNKAVSNYELAQSTLAALIIGRKSSIQNYVSDKILSNIPSEIAKGIMVAGLSDLSEFNSNALKTHQHTQGIVGNAYEAAIYAYNRNKWARHWYSQMCKTNSNEDFWRFSVLFLKVIDSRFEVWRSEYQLSGKPIKYFWSNVENRLEYRYKKWKNKREKKLFTIDCPDPIFLGKID